MLVAFLVWRGVLPAVSRVDSDFPNYYTSAKIVTEGKDVTRLYDDSWFQAQIYAHGMNQEGKFSPFPPATALIFLPLTVVDPLTALRIAVLINLALLALSIRFLSNLFSTPLHGSAIFTLLSGIGLANCFRLGQLYILLSFLVIAGYYAYTRKRKVLAGLSWGLFVPIKYYPIVILAYFGFRKEWKVAITGVVAASLVGLLGILILGWDVHKEYFSSVLGSHLGSHFSHQNPFSAAFQSWDSLLRRFFVYDPGLNPHPAFESTGLFLPLKMSILILQFIAGIGAILNVHRMGLVDPDAFSIGLLGLMALLLAPGTATYHYVLLWLPVGLLFTFFYKNGQKRMAVFILGVYAVLGFIPYGVVRQFDGDGVLTLLAYPRLALLLAMFLLTIMTVWNRKVAENVQE